MLSFKLTFFTLAAFCIVAKAAVIPNDKSVPLEGQKWEKTSGVKEIREVTHPPGIRDWLSDLIRLILGKEVSVFIYEINDTLKNLEDLISTGIEELRQLLGSVNEETKKEINVLIIKALLKALDIIMPILEQLSRVLPALQYNTIQPYSSAAELIAAILGVSFEEFLTNISTALADLDVLIVDTVLKLKDIARRVDPSVGSELENLSESHLVAARAVMKPLSDALDQILPNFKVIRMPDTEKETQ